MDNIKKTVVSKIDFDLDELDSKRLAVLIILRGRQIGRRCLLNAASLTCGRNSDVSDITFGEDPGISSKHCEFVWDPDYGTYMLRDLKSLNGTYVNGQRVEKIYLSDGDKIFLGATVLKFTFHDVIEGEFHREMEKRINIDELTGLVVKRSFDRSFETALKEAEAGKIKLSVLMMDMDGLKGINDAHGHLTGAYCIATVGKLIKEAVGDQGVATRFGGDEFTAYLTGMDKAGTVDWAELLRRRIEEFPFEKEGSQIHPTISIGVAAFPEDGKSVDALIRHADEALYRAKAAGRNRVHV